MRRRSKARECAIKVLYAMDITKDTSEVCLDDFWKNQDVTNEEIKIFTTYLVKGVEGHYGDIDAVISKYATNWQIDRMAAIDRNILRMAVFELLHDQDIPSKVTINEAVEIAKRYGDKDSGKFVNGVLDKINKEESKKSALN
ncbi:MAG: transcription antitermination factor NusB [Candidatus Omnitrophica bacterium]|nr:transcription antitermination factor NusB [Candidatus Omnitrophota bacterium]